MNIEARKQEILIKIRNNEKLTDDEMWFVFQNGIDLDYERGAAAAINRIKNDLDISPAAYMWAEYPIRWIQGFTEAVSAFQSAQKLGISIQ
ncbi:MAG: hypothetical protein BWY31_01979 [Lentisphaerae bacterium ADurb.Bin242]|nr:MAG: hypothetical protein BWY31_01979 [Lentisphaerae bacterium ADurb.Bin242]